MRRRLIGLVALAALTACSDSSLTKTTAPNLNHRIRSVIVTGSLDDNIQDLIALYKKGQENDFLKKWEQIKKRRRKLWEQMTGKFSGMSRFPVFAGDCFTE